jgi:hypothetical protein
MGEPLPVGQQVLFRQEVRDLGDLALTAVDLEGKACTCRCDGIEELKRACPQSLRFALPFGTGLRLTAFPFALGLDPACLLLQQARALSGDFRRPGRTAALNPDQTAIVQGSSRNTVGSSLVGSALATLRHPAQQVQLRHAQIIS